MGLFDKILKSAAQAIDEAARENGGSKINFTNMVNQAVNAKNEAAHSVGFASCGTTPQAAFNEASLPAKPSKLVKGTACGDETDFRYSFMLSGDFLEYDSGAAEVDCCALFEPTKDEESFEFDLNRPSFFVTSVSEDEVYKAVEAYKSNGTQPSGAYLFEPINRGKIYYKAKIDLRGQILYMYAMDREPCWKNCYVGVMYGRDVVGTALESRLMNAVDEAVRTYKEEPV